MAIDPTLLLQHYAIGGTAPATLVDAAWTRDRSWASNAELVDGRICLSGTPRPYIQGDCGGDPICNWSFINIRNSPCDAAAYGALLFQSDKWVYAQAALAQLLVSQPTSRGPAYAAAWTNWCAQVMRLVTLARWGSNIRPDYQLPLEEGDAVKAALATIWSSVHIADATKLQSSDTTKLQDRRTLTLFAPRLLSSSDRVPTGPSDFDPYCTAWSVNDTTRVVTSWGYGAGEDDKKIRTSHQPWPQRLAPSLDLRSPDWSSLMTVWFTQTLGQGYWYRIDVPAIAFYRCEHGFDPGTYLCSRPAQTVRHWFGGGDAIIALCEAMAQDVIDTPFGMFVAMGMAKFLDDYQAIPEPLRVYKDRDFASLKAALTRGAFEAAQGALGAGFAAAAAAVNVVPGAGQIASAIIAVVGLLLQGVLELLKALGVAAIGGGELAAACIPPPTIRNILLPEDQTQACNFDPTRSDEGAAAARAAAVMDAAASGAPVESWIVRVQEATGETSHTSIPLADSPPPATSTQNKWAPWLVFGGAAAVGLALIARSR